MACRWPASLGLGAVMILLSLATACRGGENDGDRDRRGSVGNRSGQTNTYGGMNMDVQVERINWGADLAGGLVGARTQAYEFELHSDQFVQFVVEQRGVDVVLRLFDSSGLLLTEIDSPNGSQGRESVSVVATDASTYRLAVVAPMDDTLTGHYQLSWRGPRPADSKDQRYVAAERAMATAHRLRRTGDAGVREEALRHYHGAVIGWRWLGEKGLEAEALLHMSRLSLDAGRAHRGLDLATACVRAYRTVDEEVAVASALNLVGQAEERLGEYDRAKEAYEEALGIFQRHADQAGVATVQNNLGNIFLVHDEMERALDLFETVLPQWTQTNRPHNIPTTLQNIAQALIALNRLEEAQDRLSEALDILARHQTPATRHERAKVMNMMARVYYRRGKPQRAVEFLQEALELLQEGSDPLTRGLMLNTLGNAWKKLGQKDRARDAYAEALEALASTAARSATAITRSNLAWIHTEMGKPDDALPLYEKASEELRRLGNRSGTASVLYGQARAAYRMGRLQMAWKCMQQAIETVEDLRTLAPSDDLRVSYFASKQDYYELATNVLMDLFKATGREEYKERAFLLSERSKARQLLEGMTRSRVIETQPASSPTDDRFARLRDLHRRLGALEQRLLYLKDSGQDPAARTAIEKKQRVVLRESNQLQRQIAASNPGYASLQTPRPMSLRELRRRVLDEATVLAHFDLGEERSFAWVLSDTELEAVELGPRSDIEEAATRLVQSLQQRSWSSLESSRELALELAQQVLYPLGPALDRERWLLVLDGALHFVPFAVLPDPFSRDSYPDDVPEGLGYTPVIDRHEVINVPSASALVSMREAVVHRDPPGGFLALVADPVFSSQDSRLAGKNGSSPRQTLLRGSGREVLAALSPSFLTAQSLDASALLWGSGEALHDGTGDRGFWRSRQFDRLPSSRGEATAILSLVPEEEVLVALGFSANRRNVLAELENYHILHFAAHGHANQERGELSGIVLSLVSPDGEASQGFIHAHEISALDLRAELAVLSGCETGLGVEMPGEGVMGLTHAFLYAGVPRVAVSLWNVSDRSTAELMERFYEALFREGLAPAAALRSAQRSMLRSQAWRVPHHWAGFVLYGEWEAWSRDSDPANPEPLGATSGPQGPRRPNVGGEAQ